MKNCARRFWRDVCSPARAFRPRAIWLRNTDSPVRRLSPPLSNCGPKDTWKAKWARAPMSARLLPDELLQAPRAQSAGARPPRRGIPLSAYARRLRSLPRRRVASRARISRQPACARCFSHQPLGAGGGAPSAASFGAIAGRRRSPGISSAARGGGRISEHLARREVHSRIRC